MLSGPVRFCSKWPLTYPPDLLKGCAVTGLLAPARPLCWVQLSLGVAVWAALGALRCWELAEEAGVTRTENPAAFFYKCQQ